VGLRTAVLTAQGFGYVFWISMLLSMAWILGGALFLISFFVTAIAVGVIEGLAKVKTPTPSTVKLWRRTVAAVFGKKLMEECSDSDWEMLFVALDKAFPDESELDGIVIATVLVSTAVAFAVGTIFWHASRLSVLYLIDVLVVLLGTAVATTASLVQDTNRLAARQIGALLRHKMEVEKAGSEARNIRHEELASAAAASSNE
jgi:hypothetical protein